MARLLGFNRFGSEPLPREITKNPVISGDSTSSENGWLIRFFDSSFFCEWIAVSYLYKHNHAGVRDYLCNRMYTLPLTGLENYLFQICYMLVHKPSPSLDKFVIDTCSKSLRIALKVHWFLMAELEDSEDSEGISRIQEKCQIAATLMGEWAPLSRSGVNSEPNTPKGRPMLNRLLSSKQKLLSLASSPSLLSPVEESGSRESNSEGSNLEDNNKLLKKLIPSPKVRDAIFFRKSTDKDEEEGDKEGFFKRLRSSKDKEEDGEKEGFFKRLIRDSKEKDEEDGDKEGFFKRLIRDSKEKEEEDGDKDGFFKRLISSNSKDKDDDDGEKDGFFKRLISDNKENDEEDGDKDGFFKRLLRDSKDEVDHEASTSSDGFLKRLFRDKDKDEKLGEEESKDKEGIFRRIFKDKMNEEKSEHDKVRSVEDDDEGFFHKFFKDKHDENKTDIKQEKITEEDLRNNGSSIDNDEKSGFFRKYFKEKNDDKKDFSLRDKITEEEDNSTGTRTCIGDDDKDGFFRTLFKDKNDKNSKNQEIMCNGHTEAGEKDGFFRRIFKDKQDQERKAELHSKSEEPKKCNGIHIEEETSDFLSFKRLFRVHPEDNKNANSNPTSPLDSSPGSENFFRRLFRDRDQSIEDSELFSSRKQKESCPGSPKQRNEKSYAKPPLPNNALAHIRKSTYHASLEFVQSLCDTSYGLVDIFPIEDRKIALHESLAEINTLLIDNQKNGDVCFPMGKGMYRVIHIPEDEAVLLNSREKAPYLICLEVLKCESPSNTKATSNAQKLSKGGIPLANGDAQLPKPPPWAYPLWSQFDVHGDETDRMLRSTSQAIDKAMAQLWEAKVKFVNVSLSVQKVPSETNTTESTFHTPLQSPSVVTEAPKLYAENGIYIENEIYTENGMKGRDDDNYVDWVSVCLSAVPGVKMEDVDDQEPPRRKEHRRVPSTIAIEEVKAAAAKGQAPAGLPLKGLGQVSSDERQKASNGIPKPTDALSGELWESRKKRIQSSSAYGKLPGWELRSFIVKSGDDCRQEHLAVQLVAHFYDIYQEAGLPLWLRPYEVLVTSSYTALIETIPDTASIHAIKSRFSNISSLRDYFVAKYEENSPSFKLAQRNFVESMAGYSILCYLLQVKDRHNGNLLMDEEGHIIHIDFGFMLSNSPGGVNFESAPFKLTRELLEVMDSDAEGNPSEFFDYFKVLCIQGFLTCRKHAEHIILLVEMLQDSGFPCFKGGPRTIQNLRKRFHLSLTEEQCVSLVLSLISSSLDAWRTRQYDYYQRVLNGIL